MKIGIDRLSFFIPNLYLDMTELAESRGDDPAKYHRTETNIQLKLQIVTGFAS